MLGTISHGNCDENIMKQVRMLLDVGSCLWYCFGISIYINFGDKKVLKKNHYVRENSVKK